MQYSGHNTPLGYYTNRGHAGLGQYIYNGLGELCGTHTASSVFLILLSIFEFHYSISHFPIILDGCQKNCPKKDFFRHPSSINDFPGTSHCFAIIIYLISPINQELMAIYRAEQSGPDQMLLPALT